MRIHRLPEELAPIVHRHASPQNLSSSLGTVETLNGVYVTGVRMPVPNANRYFSIQRNTSEPVGIDIEVNRSCELLVCFHDPAAITRGSSMTRNTRILHHERLNLDERQVSSMELNMPFWAEQMGLKRTNMKVSEMGRAFFKGLGRGPEGRMFSDRVTPERNAGINMLVRRKVDGWRKTSILSFLLGAGCRFCPGNVCAYIFFLVVFFFSRCRDRISLLLCLEGSDAGVADYFLSG